MSVAITSRQNPFVRACRALATSRTDDRVLLDGPHLIDEALDADVEIEAAAATAACADKHPDLVRRLAARAEVYSAPDTVLDAASPVRSPSGIVAIARLPWSTPRDAFGQDEPEGRRYRPAMAVALVDIQDPGNAGAVVRAVEAAGGTGVIACGATADLLGWKALRASMGSAFRVPLARESLDQLFSDAKVGGVRVVAATLDGAVADMRDIRWTEPFVLLIGNEGHGLAHDVVRRAELRVRIPMHGRVQSMNAAVSAGVILYEAERQRA